MLAKVNLSAGDYYLRVNKKYSDNSDLDYVTYELTVRTPQKSINSSSITVSSVGTRSYTGKAIKPSVTVRDGSKTLKSGTDYTLSYKNNTKPGTATITITGKGSYKGTRTVTFRIAQPFKDVNSKTAHYNDILWLYASGITKGYGSGSNRTFQPYSNVARCDMAAFLYRLAGSPAFTPTAAQKRYFSDVTSSTPHAKEIWWLAAKGISKGWTEPNGTHTFRPYDSVARGDMAAFLYRMAGSPSYTPTSAQRRYFNDVTSSTPHAREIWWLASKGISTGWENSNGSHSFRPYENVARADMAAFLHRMSTKKLVKKYK